MSEFVGEIGQRFAASIVVKSYIWRKGWGSFPRIWLLQDTSGNILTIRSNLKFKIGQEWIFDGLVKSHRLFNGQKQTHVIDWGLILKGRKI